LKIPTRLISAVITVIVWPISTSAQKLMPTNEEMVVSSVREAARETMANHRLDKVHMNMAESGIDRPISYGIAEALRSLGAEVFTGGNDDRSANSLTYDVLGFDFDYGRGASRGFLRKPMIKREFAARLRISISESVGGAILSLDDIAVSYVDDIEPRFADLVKSRDIPELAPDIPGSNWTKIVEPVVVTAAVGGLVYLFFANR
jgi:hypothetical protein